MEKKEVADRDITILNSNAGSWVPCMIIKRKENNIIYNTLSFSLSFLKPVLHESIHRETPRKSHFASESIRGRTQERPQGRPDCSDFSL